MPLTCLVAGQSSVQITGMLELVPRLADDLCWSVPQQILHLVVTRQDLHIQTVSTGKRTPVNWYFKIWSNHQRHTNGYHEMWSIFLSSILGNCCAHLDAPSAVDNLQVKHQISDQNRLVKLQGREPVLTQSVMVYADRVLKWWHHKNNFAEIMGFFNCSEQAIWKKFKHKKKWLFSALSSWDMGSWSSNFPILNSLI